MINLKNENLNLVITDSINSILEHNAYFFSFEEWEFILLVSKNLLDFLQLKGKVENEDTFSLYEIIRKIKNMHLKQLNEDNFKCFMIICGK